MRPSHALRSRKFRRFWETFSYVYLFREELRRIRSESSLFQTVFLQVSILEFKLNLSMPEH